MYKVGFFVSAADREELSIELYVEYLLHPRACTYVLCSPCR